MADARTTIVIPNYNGAAHLATLFPSIAAQSRPAARVLVVDNCSTDDSRSVAEAHAEWLGLERNFGFACGVNRGLAEVDTEFVALVNSDVILDSGWLAELEDALEDPSLSFACPLLLTSERPDLIDGTWDLLSRAGCPERALHRQSSGHPDASAPRQVQFAPMTAALFRISLFREIGNLDEAFVNYLEDVEFGLRASLAGRRGCYVPSATALHSGSATLGVWSARTTYWNARNQLLLVARHYPSSLLRKWWRPILAGNLLFLVLAARKGKFFAALHGKGSVLLRWRQWRRDPKSEHGEGSPGRYERLSCVVGESEREIERRQKEMPDGSTFWRAYFILAGWAKETR
ncbi:MAG: glycosyltransferase family 2 protein [Bryobacterales bacterium]|nr:glycosyltransferase family 2 protein [Bryobacterales bacterium]